MFNSQLDTFRKTLIETINNSNLPVGAVYFILKDCVNEISKLYEQTVQQEQQNQAKEEITDFLATNIANQFSEAEENNE